MNHAVNSSIYKEIEMDKMDAMVIEAGQVIHFHGMPLLLAENVRVFGNKANFQTKPGLDFIAIGAKEEPLTQKE